MVKTKIDIAAVKELHQAGKLDEAREGYTLLLKQNPKNVEVLHALAILSTQEEKFNDAVEYLQKAITLQPNNPLFHLHFANVLKIQGHLDQSIETLKKVIKLDPNCLSAYNNLGSAYFSQGKFSEAIQAYRTALEKQPDYVDANYNLGLALIKNNELDAAVTLLENLLENLPTHFAARFHLACTLMRQEKISQAEKHFLKIEEAHPFHFETQTNLATCFLKQGALKEARKHYTNALELAPQDTQVLFNLGVIDTQLDNIDTAIQFYQRAIQVNPDFFEAHNNLGTVFLLKQHIGLALHHFKEALRIQPHNEAIKYTVDALSKNQQLLAAPSDYIKTLFDAYADHYDAHLLKALDYQVPILLYEAVTQVSTLPKAQWDILDLGCGTGLCGIPFKSSAKTLTGIDLSSKMLEVAAQKNIYDELLASDIVPFLSDKQGQYDLILAGDVFVYVGDLSAIFENVSNALRSQGLFVFNTEISNNNDFNMSQSGRFSHHQNYLNKLAEKNHFKIIFYKEEVTRTQNNEPVFGHIYVLQKT